MYLAIDLTIAEHVNFECAAVLSVIEIMKYATVNDIYIALRFIGYKHIQQDLDRLERENLVNYRYNDDLCMNEYYRIEDAVPKVKVKRDVEQYPEDLDDFFERIWKEYPVKKGKGSVSKSQKNKLYKIGYDQLAKCIDRYLADFGSNDPQFMKHGSTFFKSGYVDYLDDTEDNREIEKRGVGGRVIQD